MDSFADFLRDDWSTNTARKLGFDDFADWIDNKPNENGLKSDSALSNLARKMVKHLILTTITIVGGFFAGKSIIKAISKNKTPKVANNIVKANDTTNILTENAINTAQKNIEVVKVIDDVPTKPLNEQLEELNERLKKGLEYEKKIGYKNLEIFEKLSDEEIRRLISTAEYCDKEKEFLLFASGNKPGMFLGHYPNIFDCISNSKITAVSLWNLKEQNLLLNRPKVKKIIEKELDFLIHRFEMPANTSADDILNMLSKNFKNKLNEKNKYIDVIELLDGSIEKNAIYSQIYYDIYNAERYMRGPYVKKINDEAKLGLDAFKNALKKFINSEKSSYMNLPEAQKQKVLNVIDSITEKELDRIYLGRKNLFLTDEYKQNEIKMLKNLVHKLEEAQKNGTKIKFD